jgi:hydrogenase-1 operon protein HyaF
MTNRPNPFVWTGEEAPQGVFVGGDESALHLIGLPQGLRRREAERQSCARMSPEARARLSAMAEALRSAGEGRAGETIALDDLSTDDLAAVLDLLGEGEVTAVIAVADGLVQAAETIFPGLWLLRRERADGGVAIAAETGDVPALVRETVALIPRTSLPLEYIVPPDGTMNVMGVLAEIRHLAAAWRAGEPNHAMNFTLLPMTEADADFLAAILGEGPVRFASGGYGSARVIATGLKRVWAVQYLNSMGQVILDTVEIGDVPGAALACPEDFADSARRLAHVLEGELQ